MSGSLADIGHPASTNGLSATTPATPVPTWAAAPLSLLLEHFPQLRKSEDREDVFVGRCPARHGPGVEGVFQVAQKPDGAWSVNHCDAGCLPSEIWALSQRPRQPGEDDGAQSPALRVLADHIIRLTPDAVLETPPRRRYMLQDANTGVGMYVQAKVGLLAGPGGSGKSWALMQLGVAQATGATWFGPRGWSPIAPGRVLVLAGEEDRDETVRRIHHAARAAQLNKEQLVVLARDLDVVALAGFTVALTTQARNGELPETKFAHAMRELLKNAVKEGRPYTLIILDPLSRFAGADVEIDNHAATCWVQLVETFTAPDCGGPSVIIAHHTAKARADAKSDPGSADPIRGASALVNGVRWAARLEQQRREDGSADLLTLRIVKANGVPPQITPLVLCRDNEHEGALRVATEGEVDSHEGVSTMVKSKIQQIEDYQERVLAAMQPGRLYSRDDLSKICGRRALVLEAVRELLAARRIEEVTKDRKKFVRLAPPELAGTASGTDAHGAGSPVPQPRSAPEGPAVGTAAPSVLDGQKALALGTGERN